MNIKNMFNAKKKADPISPQDKELRMRRRLQDHNRVSLLFQAHPSITIKGVVGSPPEKYSIVYHVDGLMQTGTSIEAKNEHTIEITLPPRYPSESPTAMPVTSLFHPNVCRDKIDLTGIWTRETSLADCIVRIGELITFKRYSTDNPLNSEAAQWALRNKCLLPLSDVDLGYREIEEKCSASMETKADLQIPSAPKEYAGEQTTLIDDSEQTKEIGSDEETVQIDMDACSTSDTVAIVQEQSGAPAPEIKEEKRSAEAAACEPLKSESPTNENERRRNPMITQNKDEIKITETGKEKILNKPISAQIAFGNDRSAPFVSQEKYASPEDPAQSRQLQVIVGPFCHRCGFRVDDYANFCGRCGAKLKLKHTNLLNKIFLIIGIIAVPILIFEVGSLIFLLNKKVPALSQLSSYSSALPEPTTPAVMPASAEKGKKQAVPQEPSAPPLIEKSSTGKMPSGMEKNQQPEVTQEPSPTVEKPAVHVSNKKAARETPSSPKPLPGAVEAPKSAPVAAEPPKSAPAVVETPKATPVASESPKPVPEAVETPKAAPSSNEPSDPSAKRRAAIEGYLSKSESPSQPENAKTATTNQAAVNDNLKLARLYMGIGSYDDAISRYREVIKVDPFNQEAMQGLIQAKKMKSSTSGK